MTSFVLPIDKPAGPTSHDIVSVARRALKTKRIGHTGTLDPFASGLLLLCVGHATRLAEYIADLPKTYEAVARFDGTTSTDDFTGTFLSHSEAWRSLPASAIVDAFKEQVGTIQQRPSSVSAKKVEGERAYERVRRGETVELAASEVTIYDIRLVAIDLPQVRFAVDCSSGTYVRAIARDVGELLGTGGYLTELRRTRNGHFSVEDALAPDALTDAAAVERVRVGMLEAVSHLPRVDITEAEARALGFGQPIHRSGAAGTVALARAGALIAIGTSTGELVRPRKVLPRD
jgi:tRNA pseudouridine55 synthase